MTKITFIGAVSDQEKAGGVVTITVTLPSGDTMHVAAATLEDKTYSIVQEFIAEGDYSAVANVEADITGSDVVYFTVTKAARATGRKDSDSKCTKDSKKQKGKAKNRNKDKKAIRASQESVG